MREIVLDTETTGLDPRDGHRIVEIACIELQNHLPTGRFFHRYINPERQMTADALLVHGLDDAFLAQHPPFAHHVDAFFDFIADAPLIIHNAEFDLAFINAELKRLGRPALARPFTDTLALARRRFPGSPASLDALCRRFAIDLSARDKHGAKLDCELLAHAYLELIGGREPGLDLAILAEETCQLVVDRPVRLPRPHAASAEELAAHAAFLEKLVAPLWLAP